MPPEQGSPELDTADEEVLADLAHKLVDQVALYGLAKDVASDPSLVAAIQRAKAARAQLLQDINAKIWRNDMRQIDESAKLGAAQKAFDRLKAASGKDDALAFSEVRRGEDYLHNRIEHAAMDERLTAHTRNFLQTVLSRIDVTRDDINELRSIIKEL